MRNLLTFAVALASLVVAACDDPADDLSRRKNHRLGDDGDTTDTESPNADPTQPGTCAVGAPHIGFARLDFVAERKLGALGENRRRVKPYSAFGTEVERVLAVTPTTLEQSSAAFGEVPARWFIEPTAGAVSLYTTYSLAFNACYASMGGAPYDAAPSATTAAQECGALQRKAWQRSPAPAEVQSCSTFVLGLTSEPSPRRRWAHACAAVMTSAGFTTY